jgi:hypothetical protein
MFAEVVIVVIIQAAPTACTSPPKFDTRLASQIPRKIGLLSGARAEARGLGAASMISATLSRLAIMLKHRRFTTSGALAAPGDA